MALASAQKMALTPSLRRTILSPQLLAGASRAATAGLIPTSTSRSIAKLDSSHPSPFNRSVRSFHHSSRDGAPNTGMMGLGGSGIPPAYFQKSSLPANTIIRFVPQQTAWIVERMGKFNRILQPGLAILIPFIDRIAYVKSLKEAAIEIPSQSAITADNVTLELDGVLYTRVFDAYKASYGVEDAEYAISQLAQTTMRSEIGQLSLDHVLKERAALNINIAEGKKQSVILASEALRAEKINRASGEAEAITLKARATASGIDAVARAIAEGKSAAQGALSLSVAEKYVDAFGKLAKEGTAVVVPGNVGDIGGMIATALSVYGKVGQAQAQSMAQQIVDRDAAVEGEIDQNKDVVKGAVDSIVEDFDKATDRR
ncbi:hypothetical protein BR93DRAFT_367699 [Coniochaeta sp. PMI_546]|nr:hypothetical protein BR93DRAFT_367699 [Coniochaeta sp. PMI_546]